MWNPRLDTFKEVPMQEMKERDDCMPKVQDLSSRFTFTAQSLSFHALAADAPGRLSRKFLEI